METEIILAAYFLFIIAIGIYSAFRIKNPSDYYVAGKKAGFLSVSGSLLATILGGSAILGTIELSQDKGWAALWFLFCASLGLFVLAPLSKYVKRLGNFTFPELLRSVYGKKVEQTAAVIIPLAWLGIVAAQIIAAAKILNGLGYFDYKTAAFTAGIIFIAYTLLGGQLSIIKTDTLQSVLIIAGLATITFFALQNNQHIQIKPLTAESLFNEKFNILDLLVLILTYSVTFIVGPDIYSRLFCAKNEKTAFSSVVFVAIVLIPVSFALTFLGVYSGHATGSGIIAFAANLIPSWAYGLFIAALLSAVMSSADTTLLTSSLILTELFLGELNNKKALRLTRIIIVLTGVLSMLVALYITSIIQALLIALTFFSGAFIIPTIAGLFQWKVNKKNVMKAIIAGGLLALSGKLLGLFIHSQAGNMVIILSYIVNAVFLFSFHKKQNR